MDNLLSEVSRSILFEGGGEGDGSHNRHGGPLFRFLAVVDGLGGEVVVVLLVAGHCRENCEESENIAASC